MDFYYPVPDFVNPWKLILPYEQFNTKSLNFNEFDGVLQVYFQDCFEYSVELEKAYKYWDRNSKFCEKRKELVVQYQPALRKIRLLVKSA